MKQRAESGVVLVGLDSSNDSRLALRWALEEAQRNGLSVHLVHCHEVLLGAAGLELAASGRRLLEEGLALCRDYPQVRVTAEALRGPSIAASLLAASEAASMVVVGCRGRRSPQGLLWGSVSEHLSRHATCPVVTVRPPWGMSPLLGSISQSVLHHAHCPVAVVGLTTRAVRSPLALPHTAAASSAPQQT
jgi:nucleotide-binding universal stress UspA family protein